MPSRREFLFQAAATAMGLGAVRLISGCETIETRPKTSGGAFDFITRNENWYWQSGHGTSQDEAKSLDLSRDNWQLRLTGPGGEIAKIGFDDLRSMADQGRSTTYIKTMRCVVGTQIGAIADTRISTGVFTGIPLPELFADHDVPAEAAAKVRTYGSDGFTSNLDADRALQEGPDPLPAMLAYRMNGRELPTLRGGPVRLVIPEMWGYKNMKWLSRLHFTESDDPFGGYETGLFKPDPDADDKQRAQKVQDLIDGPGRIALTDFLTRPAARSGVELEGPDISVKGATVAGGARIDSVEIALDGGSFESVDTISKSNVLGSEELPAETRRALEKAVNFGDQWPPKSVWTIWSKSFEGLESGTHEITIRSKDSQGRATETPPDEINQLEQLRVAGQVTISFDVK